MEISVLESTVSDNYFYGLTHGDDVALIDPVDGRRAVDWVESAGGSLTYLVNTHFHQDHIGGNPTVLEAFPSAQLVVGDTDADRVLQSCDPQNILRVEAGDAIDLGATTLDVFDTPGHTPGHISLKAGDHLFSGDTIFVGGAGNCSFGGDPGQLYRTFRDVLSNFDDATTFYPGHDYAERDIEFIRAIEPDNTRAEAMLERSRSAEARTDNGLFLTTLGEERSYNPFFRADESTLQEHLRSTYADTWAPCRERSDSDAEAAFRTVRMLRNDW
jgi:hydroxyacylglutathione hydrolase